MINTGITDEVKLVTCFFTIELSPMKRGIKGSWPHGYMGKQLFETHKKYIGWII